MEFRMLKRLALTAALLLAPVAAHAQSAAEHVAMGDRDHAARNAASALAHYEAALTADPQHYPAAWKAALVAVDLGEYQADAAQRKALYAKAEGYARRAASANPSDAEGHFVLARAVGRNALSMGKRDRVKFANEVRNHALTALKANPAHPGALHVLGVWNAEIMRLSGMERFFAKNLLGGKTFSQASWNDAVRYLEQAVAAEPDRITHRLDLAAVYADVGNTAKAREHLEWIARATPTDYNDANYKREAAERLRTLK
jgi:tetratricopeptide (TPR) repeat protein